MELQNQNRFFVNSRIHNQTRGTRMYFTADRRKISYDKIVVINARLRRVMKKLPSEFSREAITIQTGDRVRIHSASFASSACPFFYAICFDLPQTSDRSPASHAYFQRGGRKAFAFLRRITSRLAVRRIHSARRYLSKRGLARRDLRTRANRARFQSRFTSSRRVFGPSEDADHPRSGGSSFYIDSVHYFRMASWPRLT